MSTLHPEELEALAFLERLGLIVVPVPTAKSKTPEFLVNGDTRGYAVEVKARRDTDGWERALRGGEVAYQKRAMGYARWCEDVAHNALKQLKSVDLEHTRWWVLWLSIGCRAGIDAMFNQAVGSLFGVRQVVYYDPDSDKHLMRDCLFAKPGVFERHHQFVSAVVTVGQGITLCVNEFAEDYGSFQDSVLYRWFARIHPPITAKDLAENRGFFQIKDLSIDRSNEGVISSYLMREYSLKKAVVLDMAVHSASQLIDRKEVQRKEDSA